MAKNWVAAEERDVLAHFLRCAPVAVVHGMPKGHGNILKFPRFSMLSAFFNEYAAVYPWRDNPKTGLECCNGVKRLLDNLGISRGGGALENT
jgi:hypothetical protein